MIGSVSKVHPVLSTVSNAQIPDFDFGIVDKFKNDPLFRDFVSNASAQEFTLNIISDADGKAVIIVNKLRDENGAVRSHGAFGGFYYDYDGAKFSENTPLVPQTVSQKYLLISKIDEALKMEGRTQENFESTKSYFCHGDNPFCQTMKTLSDFDNAKIAFGNVIMYGSVIKLP